MFNIAGAPQSNPFQTALAPLADGFSKLFHKKDGKGEGSEAKDQEARDDHYGHHDHEKCHVTYKTQCHTSYKEHCDTVYHTVYHTKYRKHCHKGDHYREGSDDHYHSYDDNYGHGYGDYHRWVGKKY